jgi:hypothetical protein
LKLKRLINGNALYRLVEGRTVEETGEYSKGYNAALKAVKSDLNNQNVTPTIDATETRHGWWIDKPISGSAPMRCSACKRLFVCGEWYWKYCPNCGARMDLEEHR